MIRRLEQLSEERRRTFLPDTDAYRLLPEGMLWRGVSIDYLADRLLVSLRGTQLPVQLRQWLEAQGADTFIKQLTQGEKHAPEPLNTPALPPQFTVCESRVRYRMDMESGYSQGLFLDQRDNRLTLRKRCRPGCTVLNLFAYTGAFSVCAALAGATTTTLDLAQPCLSRARENMELNNIDPTRHFFCRGEALEWLHTFARQGRNFDLIVLDPPTFSRDARGHIWRAERDYTELVRRAVACLVPEGGQILCATNCRTISSPAFRQMVAAAAPAGARLLPVPMPFDFAPDIYLKTLWIQT